MEFTVDVLPGNQVRSGWTPAGRRAQGRWRLGYTLKHIYRFCLKKSRYKSIVALCGSESGTALWAEMCHKWVKLGGYFQGFHQGPLYAVPCMRSFLTWPIDQARDGVPQAMFTYSKTTINCVLSIQSYPKIDQCRSIVHRGKTIDVIGEWKSTLQTNCRSRRLWCHT
jgi:hypothetical protein